MIDEEPQFDVKVINAFKSYGQNIILNGLNMKVASGSIYALLGPSGCGKSTLLQCILETMALDSGHIDLKAESLKHVGYMPQSLCLEDTLTIKETFEYFGTLYNMTKRNIDIRIDELNQLLQFPDLNSLIKDLSGGQSRRISLAVSLFHDPRIIILDEPTVGIDPLLRQKIWAEFKNMAENHGKTIIITTHYIEEAHQANCIGLMRNGVIIDEGSPQNILRKYHTDSLETAFLTLCYNEDKNEMVRHIAVDPINDTRSNRLSKFGKRIDHVRIKALLKKNVHVLSRDYWLLFTLCLLPIVQIFNFCAGVGVNVKGLKVAIKSDEINLIDCQYSNTDGCIFDENANQPMSCIVINHLASLGYTLIEVDDRYAGEKIMNNTNFIAFIHFPTRFSKDLTKFIDDPDNYSIQSKAYFYFAKFNILYKNQIVMDLMISMRYLMDKTLNSCSINPKVVGIPMTIDHLIGKEVKSYGNSVVAIFVAMGSIYFSGIYSVSTMASEKMDGLLGRSMFAGVTVMELLISMFCISNFLFIANTTFPLLIAYVFFSNPIQVTSGLFVYGALMIILSWIGFLFGLLAVGVSPIKSGGVHIMNGWAVMQMLLSGGIWPLEGQPSILRTVTELLPMRLASKTMNDIALKGWAWDHPLVVKGTTAAFAHVIIMILILICLSKVKKDMWVHK